MKEVYVVFFYDDCDYDSIVSRVFSSEEKAKIYVKNEEKNPDNEYYKYYIRKYEVE